MPNVQNNQTRAVTAPVVPVVDAATLAAIRADVMASLRAEIATTTAAAKPIREGVPGLRGVDSYSIVDAEPVGSVTIVVPVQWNASRVSESGKTIPMGGGSVTLPDGTSVKVDVWRRLR